MTGLIEQLGASAREAATTLATLSGEARKHALDAMAAAIEQHGERILAANAFDLEQAEKRALNAAMIDRLRLDRARVCAIADAIARVAALADPVGRELAAWKRPNGLDIRRVAVPIGVIGVIYESRPNVTADAAALCLRAGNAVILRGGSEAVESNRAIYRALIAGLAAGPVPQTAVQIVPDQDRALVGEMLRASRHIDVVVPRGGDPWSSAFAMTPVFRCSPTLTATIISMSTPRPNTPWPSTSWSTPRCAGPASAVPSKQC